MSSLNDPTVEGALTQAVSKCFEQLAFSETMPGPEGGFDWTADDLAWSRIAVNDLTALLYLGMRPDHVAELDGLLWGGEDDPTGTRKDALMGELANTVGGLLATGLFPDAQVTLGLPETGKGTPTFESDEHTHACWDVEGHVVGAILVPASPS